ncbi:MAG: hypothetical protein GXN99_00635 [Candidatus Nanohaloarchaeota archaeon]|nr:hypothetical protein [Candidatus Nanohaloarchaeota archaeon]
MFDYYYLDRSNVLYEDWNEELKWAVVGAGMDTTETYLPGQRLGPNSIRNAIRRKDSTRLLNDLGNIMVVHGDVVESLNRIQTVISSFLGTYPSSKIITLGGEHTITYAVVKSLLSIHDELQLISLDAHYDAYDKYETLNYSHATVMRRINELKRVRVIVKGVRRYAVEEESYAIKHFSTHIDKTIPTYLSIDLDYFDPSIAPGVSDKESNGYYFKDFKDIVKNIKNLVGFDVVELNPFLDVSETTANLAADIILELVNKK